MIRKSSGQVTAARAMAFLTSANGAHVGAGYAEAPGALIFLVFYLFLSYVRYQTVCA
jgi:hypothetical protein